MYNDELDMILEDAYEDGYYQALADMGYEFDDAEEDVDIFDEDCFDDAAEGAARAYRRKQNKDKSPDQIRSERENNQTPHDKRYTHHSGEHSDPLYHATKKGSLGHATGARYNMGDVSNRNWRNYQPKTKKLAALYEKMRSDPEEAQRIEGKIDEHYRRLDADAGKRIDRAYARGSERYLHQ